MSLYTPVFPSFHESSTSCNGNPESTLAAPIGKRQTYVEFLRDIHLFLSTQNDMLSPPSRPGSPFFDRRVEKVRDEVKSVISATKGETSSGKWTRISQTLKLGCVRGRHWSVSGDGPYPPEEDPNFKWILPDEESEWIKWEENMAKSRRLKLMTNTSQQMDTAASFAPESLNHSHADFAKQLTRAYNSQRELRPRDVSPTTLRAAKEKVKKWQASMGDEVWRSADSSIASTSTGAAVTREVVGKGKTERPQQGSGTLDFAVVKPAARTIIDKKGKGSLSHSTGRGGSAPVRLHESKSSKVVDVPETRPLVNNDQVGSKQPSEALLVKDNMPKIADVPETPYLPPSFPAHLETSTPLPDSGIIIRAKPSPIFPLPTLSSTPLPSSPADPPNGCQLELAEPHAAKVSSSLPPHSPQIDIMQPRKRSRALSPSPSNIPNYPRPVTPPAKRLRPTSRDRSTSGSGRPKAVSPNGGLNKETSVRDEAQGRIVGSTASCREKVDTVEMTSGVPSTLNKNEEFPTRRDLQDVPEKPPSPTKSVKSYFSAPDSDAADSPLKANLLLESPLSPMLSYAQNPSSFLPQITSTQAGKGSPSAGRTNQGRFGMGFSSQFDVERHVDRVSEMLEKDVEFEGWLRDVRTVDRSGD